MTAKRSLGHTAGLARVIRSGDAAAQFGCAEETLVPRQPATPRGADIARTMSAKTMRVLTNRAVAMMLVAGDVAPMLTDAVMIEDFNLRPQDHWRFFADTVMGGVSSGGMRFVTEDGRTHARMTGRVSTENNGGFIQMQRRLSAPPPEGTTEVCLIVRGNDQRYFVHLRTTGTLLPWQYYQAGFDVTRDWTEVRLPFDAFRPAGGLLPGAPQAGSLTAVGIVAYGRDHDAEIEVRELGFS